MVRRRGAPIEGLRPAAEAFQTDAYRVGREAYPAPQSHCAAIGAGYDSMRAEVPEPRANSEADPCCRK